MLNHLYNLTLIFLAGICAFSAFQHSTLKRQRPQHRVHLLFGALSLLASLMALTNTMVFQATSVADYLAVLRLNLAIAILLCCLITWFFAEYSGMRPMPILISFSTLIALLFFVNLTLPNTVLHKEIQGIEYITLPWGERIARAQATPGPWAFILMAAILFSLVFAFCVLVARFRRDRKRTVLIMILAEGLTLFTTTHGLFVRLGIIQFVPLGLFGILGMVIIMGITLNHEMREEQKKAETELNRSRANLKSLIESTKDMIWSVDLNYRLLSFNTTFAEHFRISYGTKAFIGAKFEDLLPKERAEIWPSLFQKVMNEGEYQLEYILPDGRILELAFQKIVQKNKTTGFSVFGKDISERVQAEEIIRKNEESLKEAQRIAGLGNWELDLSNNKLFLSDEIFRIFEINPKKFNASYEAFLDSIHPDDRDAFNKAQSDSLKNKTSYEIEHRILMQDGRVKHVHARCRTFYDSDGKPLSSFGTIQDITNRKLAEDEKDRLEAMLHQAQKIESVGRLAGGVAHDFNNMLGVILGYAEMAMRKVPPSTPVQKDLKEIIKAAERSADLTRQLLAFARKQTVVPKVLELNATVEGMLKMLRRLIGESVHLSWQPSTDLWPVSIDPSQIDQLLANLCINARDAITDVGNISIETGNSYFDEDYCAHNPDFLPGEYLQLSVSDDGCGMDKETQSQIFEPFFTTKELGRGTGLGLSTVYGIVRQNKGFINVYSEPGHGTTFKVYLPRHKGKEAVQEQTKNEYVCDQRGNETILLVEDETAFLKLTSELLKSHGYTVLAANSPDEAIQLAQGHNGDIHLLMTDVIMPKMNGLNLAKILQGNHPFLKHLFMSGYTANIIGHHGVLDEGVNFIQKPFSMKNLMAKVRDVLDNSV